MTQNPNHYLADADTSPPHTEERRDRDSLLTGNRVWHGRLKRSIVMMFLLTPFDKGKAHILIHSNCEGVVAWQRKAHSVWLPRSFAACTRARPLWDWGHEVTWMTQIFPWPLCYNHVWQSRQNGDRFWRCPQQLQTEHAIGIARIHQNPTAASVKGLGCSKK